MFEISDLESRRFGLRVARCAQNAEWTSERLQHAIVQARLDLLILRFNAANGSNADVIRQTGLPGLHADTLVTYTCPLPKITVRPARDQTLDLRPATAVDTTAIRELVEQVFARYPNHYTANPILDRALSLAGYCEWALSHIDHAERSCWLSWHEGKVSGIACSRHDPASGRAVGVLHGIGADFVQRGIYTDLIRATQHHYQALGYQELSISTQVGNLPVQRVWTREGFVLEQVEHTWHLHPLFSAVLDSDGQALHVNSVIELRNALLAESPTNAVNWALKLTAGANQAAQLMLYRSLRSLPAGGHCYTALALDRDQHIVAWTQSRFDS